MRKGKRLIKGQDAEIIPKKQSIKKGQVEASDSEEEKCQEQEEKQNKFQKFSIVNDDKYQSQGTMDKFLNKNNKTEGIQPKQNKIIEIIVEEPTIFQQKRSSMWGGGINSEDNDIIEKEEEYDLSHLIGFNRENLNQKLEQQVITQTYNEQPIVPQQQPIKLQQQPIQFMPTIVESISIREELDKMVIEDDVQENNFSAQKTKINNQGLRGMTYMIAGEYPSLKKQDIQNIIKFYGGQIQTVRLKPQNYLIKGEYYVAKNIQKNIEENQYVKEAIKLNCKILDFKAFDQHLKELTNNSIQESLVLTQQEDGEVEAEIKQSTKKEPEIKFIISDSVNIPYFGASKTKDKDQIPNQHSSSKEILEIVGQNSISLQKSQQQQQQQQQQQKKHSEQLWSIKHAPKRVTDCIDQTHVTKIVNWLHDWGKVKPILLETKTFQAYNTQAKALLLSGPPGIGKTTIIRQIAKQMNYQLIEWNASDVRSKSQIENYVKHLQDNTVLKFNNDRLVKENMTIILMDEVDGMSGSDKGGNKCLIDMIKLTKQPIVCICNDRNNAKMRSLSLHCLDLQFKKPNIDEVQKKLELICREENLSYDVKELRQLIEFSQCDIRQLLNSLQMHSFGLKTHLSEKANKDSSVTTNIFEAGKTLLSYKDASTMSLYQLMELYFIDPDILQLMYHENYLDTRFQSQNSSAIIEKIAMASQSISEADVLNTRIKRNNEWSLMPNVGFYSCVYPTQKMQSNLFGKVNFPKFLGKISSQNKCKRQLLELKDNFGKQTYLSSVKQIKFQLIEPFAFIAISQLSKDGVKSFENVHNLLKNYNLNIATFDECLIQCLSLFPKRDLYQSMVEESVRTQFTKFCKKTMDSAQQMESGGSRRQFQGERTQKYNELEDEVAEEEEEQEEESKKKKQVTKTTVKQGKTQKQQNKNGKKPAGGKKKK